MSKKAVIKTGGKQYIISKGDQLDVELIKSDKKNLVFEPLLVFDEDKATIGAPTIANSSVTAEIIETKKDNKVTAIRYKPKKRVRKIKGHRQTLTTIKITDIKAA